MLEKVPTPDRKVSTDYGALSWISTFYVQSVFQRPLENVPTALEKVPTGRWRHPWISTFYKQSVFRRLM